MLLGCDVGGVSFTSYFACPRLVARAGIPGSLCVGDWFDGKDVSLVGFVLVSLQEVTQKLVSWVSGKMWICLTVDPVLRSVKAPDGWF